MKKKHNSCDSLRCTFRWLSPFFGDDVKAVQAIRKAWWLVPTTWPGTQSSVQRSQAREFLLPSRPIKHVCFIATNGCLLTRIRQTGSSWICFIHINKQTLLAMSFLSFSQLVDSNSRMNPGCPTGERRWSDSQVWPGLDACCQVPDFFSVPKPS